MNIVEIIGKKRDNIELSREEIEFFVQGYTKGNIPDYQISPLLMAIYLNGMTPEEASNLTLSMLNSGDKIDLSSINGVKVDKHSTGGVGDKTTIVLAPLVAYFGVPVAKMSGRGLGHTGGTTDKLESIAGFKVDIDPECFIKQVREIGIALVGQSGNLTPADKKIYALRDVTGTVASIPLIASSIMSKKLASGADSIVLDVKVGRGAFMKTVDDAKKLANAMVEIGNLLGRKTTAIITDMDEPLGFAIGNSLEVIEAIETLKGNGPKDLVNLVAELGAEMLVNALKFRTVDEAKKEIIYVLENGLAVSKLKDMVERQSGDSTFIDDITKFTLAANQVEIKAEESGIIHDINAIMIGEAAMTLGAGRATKEDQIDMSVGIVLSKKVNDTVNKGDTLAIIYHNSKGLEECVDKVKNSFVISDKKSAKKLIYDIVK